MDTLKNMTTLQWIGVIILFNTTLLGGSSQLGDLALTGTAVKAILAVATLGNGFLGGLVTMFGGQAAMVRNVDQATLVRSVLAMPGVEHLSINAQANQTLASFAVDPTIDKIAPTPEAKAQVSQIAKGA